jgi:internalin A
MPAAMPNTSTPQWALNYIAHMKPEQTHLDLSRVTVDFGQDYYEDGPERLEVIPPEVLELNIGKLTSINLSGNALISLPDWMEQLSQLIELDVQGNEIKEIPEFIVRLPKLQRLIVDNPVTEPPPEVVSKGLEGMRAYYDRLTQEGIALSYEAKLLILGEGGAGKTTLRKKIEDAGYLVDPAEKSTDGIDVIRWKFEQDSKEFRVNMWDFGGQEVHHATHQFFLSARSLIC